MSQQAEDPRNSELPPGAQPVRVQERYFRKPGSDLFNAWTAEAKRR